MAQNSSRNMVLLAASLVMWMFSLVAKPAEADQFNVGCERGTNYTKEKTPFQGNLDTALSQLETASLTSHYHNASVGSAPHRAYATYMCRLDLPLARCRDCVANATSDFQAYCPAYWEASDLFRECAVQYANHSLVSAANSTIYIQPFCDNPNMGDPLLRRTIEETMSDLIENATSSGSAVDNIYYLGTGEGSYMQYQRLHGLVQCSPEQTASSCRTCLRDSMKTLLLFCDSAIGATSFGIGCGVKYSLYGFYNTTAGNSTLLLAPPPSSPSLLPPPANSSPVFPSGNMGTTMWIGLLLIKLYLWSERN